jgi:hypothetical protein
MRVRGGVDSFSCVTIIGENLRRALGLELRPANMQLYSMGGTVLPTLGVCQIWLGLDREMPIKPLEVYVVRNLGVVDVLLGHDAHTKLGTSLCWNFSKNEINYLLESCVGSIDSKHICVKCEDADLKVSGFDIQPGEVVRSVSCDGWIIDEPDFICRRDSEKGGRWIVRYKWREGVVPQSNAYRYKSQSSVWYPKKWISETKMNSLVEEWIEKGVIEPVAESCACFIIPLNPVLGSDLKTTKIRLALDFKLMNQSLIEISKASSIEDCAKTVRSWRVKSGRAGGYIIDLKSAYHCVALDEGLQEYNCVKWRGVTYKCTAMMFGVTCGGRVLNRILSKILVDESEAEFYRDDIFVPDGETAERVSKSLAENGFVCKPAVAVDTGENVRALGLTVSKNQWIREEQEVGGWQLDEDIVYTVRQLSGWINRLTAVAPVQQWLRPVGCHIKSLVGKLSNSIGWDAMAEEAISLVRATKELMRMDNPMKGQWSVPADDKEGSGWVLYTDASKELEGGVLMKNDIRIEDFASTTKSKSIHINVKELNALIEGVRLCKSYAVDRAKIYCDNRAVVAWVSSRLDDRPVKSNAMYFDLIESRLEILHEMILAAGIQVTIEYIETKKNPADNLTRLPWLHQGEKRMHVKQLIVEKTKLSGKNFHDQIEQNSLNFVGLVHEGESVIKRSLSWLHSLERRENDQEEVLWQFVERVHTEMIHPSVWMIVKVIEPHFPSRSVRRIAQQIVDNCGICAKKVSRLNKGPVDLGKSFVAERVGHIIFVDSFKVDSVCFVNIIDGYSRFVLTLWRENVSPTGEQTKSMLLLWISIFGTPKFVRSDRGSEMRVLDELSLEFGFRVQRGSVQYPQAQGVIERYHRTILTLIRSQEDKNISVVEKYLRGLYVYLRRPHTSLFGLSPLEVIGGVDLRDYVRQQKDDALQDDELFVEEEAEAPEFEPEFSVDQKVLWFDKGMVKSKFPWREGVVMQTLDKGAYKVKFDKGKIRTVNESALVATPRSEVFLPAQRISESTELDQRVVEANMIPDERFATPNEELQETPNEELQETPNKELQELGENGEYTEVSQLPITPIRKAITLRRSQRRHRSPNRYSPGL